MSIAQAIKDKAVDYSLKSIRYICEKIGPRESGMPNERKAQEWLKDELIKNGWADEAKIEEFTVSRHGLVGFSKVVGTMMLAAVAMLFYVFFGAPPAAVAITFKAVALGFSLITLAIAVFEFVLYKPFIDPFLPKTTSANVYARYKSSGETKKRIVFSGHCDSAYEWTLMKLKPQLMVGAIILAALGVLAAIGILIAALVSSSLPLWELIVIAAFTPVYISLFFICNFRCVVPGANDNLTGVMASVSVLKCLKEAGIRYPDTEVAVVLTGSEEAGLRGAKAWAKAHKEEIDKSGVDTVFIALETLRDWEHFCIYTKDMTCTVKLDEGVVSLLDKATAAAKRPLKHAIVPFGSSDAAAVAQAGLRAGCVAGMDPAPADYYHNCGDTPDNMDRKSFAYGLDMALEAARIFAEEGAPTKN